MRNLTTIRKALPRNLRFIVCSLLFAGMFSAPGIAAAVIVGSDFESGDEGWLGHACIGAGLCSVDDVDWTAQLSHVQTGGSAPGGGAPVAGNKYIDLVDPGEPQAPGVDYAARLEPNPVTYAGAFTYGRTVTFDALIRTNGGGGTFDGIPEFGGAIVAPLLAIETTSGTLVYLTTQLPTIDGDWEHYSITLKDNPLDNPTVTGNGWVFVDAVGNVGDPNQNPAAFANFLATQFRTTVIAEWLKEGDEIETGGIDNFQVVPIPPALPLLAAALLGLGFTRRAAVPA